MDKYKKLISNTAILGIGTFGSKILVFLLLPLYTAYLSTEQYGTADIITQSANLLMPLMAIGIVDAVFRFTLDRNLDKRNVLTTGLFLLLAGFVFFVLLFPLLNLIDYFEGYMWLIILYAFVANVHSLLAQYVRAKGLTAFFALQGIIATALTIALNILLLVVMKIGLMGYVLSVVVADLIVSGIIAAVIKKDISLNFKYFDRALAKKMLAFSIPLIPTTVFWWITNVSDRYMVKGMIGSHVNGLYAAAFKIPTLLILVSGIFIEAWQFSAVTERDTESKKAHEHFFGTVFDSFQGMLFICGSGLIAFSKIFSRLLFADSYFDAWQYMPVLITATVFSSLVTFMGSVYLVDKKSVHSFVTAFIGAAVNICFNLLLIPSKLGANGAALATFLSYFIVFIIRAINTRKFIRFNLHIPKLSANTVIVGVQSAFMVLELPYWIDVQVGAIVAIFIINAKPILNGVLKVLRRK